MINHRIHYRAPGRSFVACQLAPVIHATDDRELVDCERCRRALLSNHERARALPTIPRQPRTTGART